MSELIEHVADQLYRAFTTGTAIRPLHETHAELDLEHAYSVQRALVARHGLSVEGRKVGLTSRAMRNQLGVDAPDHGVLLQGFVFASGAAVSLQEPTFIEPRVEAEIGFALRHELRGPGVHQDDVMAATDVLMPTLEIIDSRIADWRISLVDTVADNASGWGAVVGLPVAPLTPVDLRTVRMELYRDGELLAAGTGEAVLGHPARAVAWLANTLADYGEALPARQPILSGSLTAAAPLSPGVYCARFSDGLGSVSLEVSE